MRIFKTQDWHHADEELPVYQEARRAHAYRLRGAGLTLDKIGDHIGVSKERARQMIIHHALWLRPRYPVQYPYYGWEGKN